MVQFLPRHLDVIKWQSFIFLALSTLRIVGHAQRAIANVNPIMLIAIYFANELELPSLDTVLVTTVNGFVCFSVEFLYGPL